MKMKCLRVCMMAGGLAVVSGCVVEPNGTIGFQPIVIAPTPVVEAGPPEIEAAPAVEVPDSYVWDGVEFVGVVGDQYFYLGPDNVWIVCDPVRLERFHGWERIHPDWRDHAVRNDRFRADAHGHVAPMRDERDNHVQPGHGQPQKPAPKKKKDDSKNQ